MRAFARMKGYVIVDAILFDTAANRNVSRDECVLAGLFPIERVFGGNVVLNSSNR
jgi:hypothetical protein